MKDIKIEDYSLNKGELFAQVSLPTLEGEANFFNISFDEWDVIEAALSLNIIEELYDYDNGRNGQQMLISYIYNENTKFEKVVYYDYSEVVDRWFNGEAEEAIILHIAMKDTQIENALTLRAI